MNKQASPPSPGALLGLPALRAAKGWSQETLAKEAGTTLNTICKAENGRQWPRQALVNKLCEIFECQTDRLFKAPPPATASPTIAHVDGHVLDSML